MAGFDYYRPINEKQAEFHASKAKHKLLIGGYGAGKSYPAIHECIFHALENPRHNFYFFRNTWDQVEENIEADVVRICEDAGVVLHKGYDKDKHDLTLIDPNHPGDPKSEGCTLRFRPLTLGRAKLKGIHCCGFMIDDPFVRRNMDLMSFLYTRLRNPPKVEANRFISVITANYEGHDWLWKTYMDNREEGGDGEIAYWVMPTTGNPTLPSSYIPDLELIHSQDWIDRYVHCKLSSFIGLVYHSFKRELHGIAREEVEQKDIMARILAVDLGIGHATAVLDMCTDGENIYTTTEMWEKGLNGGQVGTFLVEMVQKNYYNRLIIDPASAKREQTSGVSMRDYLRKEFGLHFLPGINNRSYGFNLCRDLLKPVTGDPRTFIVIPNCPRLVEEIGIYRFDEPKNIDLDEMNYKEDAVKEKDDAVDAWRYGTCYLYKFLKRRFDTKVKTLKETEHQKRWDERYAKLAFYRTNPRMAGRTDLINTYKKLGFSHKKINDLLSTSK